MRMPPLLADLIHARGCKLKCEKFLTLPLRAHTPYQAHLVKKDAYSNQKTMITHLSLSWSDGLPKECILKRHQQQ